jgi:tripartite-type tricarboxylate transporter receptor subunit TctC
MRFVKNLTVQFLSMFLVASTFAQAYPSKPVKLIVPFPPGGTTDIVARIVASKLTPILGQPIVVENRAGAGGTIGAAEIARAPADGYTLGIGTVSTLGTNAVAYKNNKLNPATDFTHITNLASVPGVIVVNRKFPFSDYRALVEELKKNPSKHNYASAGAGGVGHLAMELFLVETGAGAQHVPYKGSAPAVTDVLAGNVPIMWDNLSSSLPHIKSGQFIAIGIAFPKRASQLPDVPTFAELGLKGYEADTWFGLIGPANMSNDVLKKLHDATLLVLRDADTVKKLEENGAVVIGNTPGQFKEQVTREVAKWRRVVETKNIALDF